MSVRFNGEAIDKHRDLADAIKNGCAVDGSTIKETESHSAYNANLPEGLTPATIKEVARYNTNFVKAAHVAVGELSADIMSKDKTVDKCTAQLGFFAPGDTLGFTAERSRMYPNPQAAEGEPNKVTKHLVLTMTTDIRGQSVKSIRDTMSESFKNQFC